MIRPSPTGFLHELGGPFHTGLEKANLQPTYNVRAFGAVGDGVSDDTNAIQAALDAAATGNLGGTVFFPVGYYLVTGLTFSPRVSLMGAGIGTSLGQGSTLRLADGSDTHLLASSVNSSTVHHWSVISNLYLNGNGTNQAATSDCIHFDGPTGEGTKIEHCYVTSAYRHDIYVAGGTVPLYFEDLHLFSAGRSGSGSGIKIERPSGGVILSTFLMGVSGDNNADALIEIDSCNGGPVVMCGVKSEANTAGRQANAILINDGDFGKFVVIGAAATASPTAGANSLIRVEGNSTSARVAWYGIDIDANIPYLYDNNATGVQVATNASGSSNNFGFDASPLFLDPLLIGTSATLRAGTGSPEASVTADDGSVFLRTDGGDGATMYLKRTGTGNTGWAPVTNGFVSASKWETGA